MDRVAQFVTATALTLAGIIILGPGGASMLAQCWAGQALVSLKPNQTNKAKPAH